MAELAGGVRRGGFFPLNWAAVADYQAAHHALYGRYPSFARLMKNARIRDQLLVFDEM